MVRIDYMNRSGSYQQKQYPALNDEAKKEIKRLYIRRMEAKVRDSDDNVIGRVWKDGEKWNYFYEN